MFLRVVSEKKRSVKKWHTAEDSAAPEGTSLARCLKRHAPTVAKRQRSLLSRPKADLFIAGSASRNTEQREEAHAGRRVDSGAVLID
jgi:hypothetical protein